MAIIAVFRKFVAVTVIVLSGSGVVVASSAAPAVGAAGRVPKGDAFYVPPRPLAKAKAGTIIRSTLIGGAPTGARAWKILYHSRVVDGRDIAVSGVVIAPTGAAPRGGRVVVTWAHGTSGMADVCAPSKQSDIASGNTSTSGPAGFGAAMPYVQTFLDAGYVVAATDYEGVGTPGLHPFLVGESEGRSVLDAARAAHDLKGAAAASKVLVLGHSQGGHAALFAGELAASYAPELRVLGVAAEAPGPDVEHTLPSVASATFANGYVVSVVEGFHAAYPTVRSRGGPHSRFACAGIDRRPEVSRRRRDDVLEHAPRARTQPARHPSTGNDRARELLWQPSNGRAVARRPGNRRSTRPTIPHWRVRDEGLRGG